MSLVKLRVLDAADTHHLPPQRRVFPEFAHGPQRGPRVAVAVQGDDAEFARGADALEPFLSAGADLVVQGEAFLQLAGLRLQWRQRCLGVRRSASRCLGQHLLELARMTYHPRLDILAV